MNQHTPGPWHVGKHSHLDIYADEQQIVIPADDMSLIEAKANARLIAKAPEMLEALKWLINADDEGEIEQGQYAKRGLALARALLREIEGMDDGL